MTSSHNNYDSKKKKKGHNLYDYFQKSHFDKIVLKMSFEPKRLINLAISSNFGGIKNYYLVFGFLHKTNISCINFLTFIPFFFLNINLWFAFCCIVKCKPMLYIFYVIKYKPLVYFQGQPTIKISSKNITSFHIPTKSRKT